MTDHPKQKTGNPKPQAETDRSGQGAVENSDCPRRAAEQDWLKARCTGAKKLQRARPSDQDSATE